MSRLLITGPIAAARSASVLIVMNRFPTACVRKLVHGRRCGRGRRVKDIHHLLPIVGVNLNWYAWQRTHRI